MEADQTLSMVFDVQLLIHAHFSDIIMTTDDGVAPDNSRGKEGDKCKQGTLIWTCYPDHTH